MIKLRAFFIVIVAMFAMAGSAFPQVTDPPLEDPEPIIETQSTDAGDLEIQSRIVNIFSKIEGINGVEVKVEAGVVTLSGAVPNEAMATDAKDIAIRTAGVVTVEDEIDRTLDVRGNVAPVIAGLQDSFNTFKRALPLIGIALIIFLLFGFVGGRVARFSRFWRKIAPNPFLADLLAQAARLAFLAAGAIIALNILGASKFVTTILGGAGVAGIAIGFAVRDSLENYISSIMLSLRQPFRANDHVIINAHEGIVVRLTSRATILMTLDGNHLRIPNSVVFKGIILNYTTNPERRFDFELGIDAADDPVAAMQVGLDAIKSNDFILKDPKPGAVIKIVGDSNIVIRFTGWVNQSETAFGKARSLSIKAAMSVLEEQGFTLPEPIYRLRFDTPMQQALEAGVVKTSKASSKSSAIDEPKTTPAISGDAIDTAPDTHLTDKASEERAHDAEEDLLDHNRPTE